MKTRSLFGLAWMTFGFVGAVSACNAIVGVTDVRLRKDPGLADADDQQQGDDGSSEAGPPPSANVLEVALGTTHTCARKPDGTVKCWGDDTQGQTGTNGVADGSLLQPTATSVKDAIHIASGKSHTCVVRKSGQASCWGSDVSGQLGDGNTNAKSPVPVDVKGLGDAKAICAGGNFSCAVRAGGTAVCWGDNLSGQLGSPGTNGSAVPVAVSNLSGLAGISCGELHACAVTQDGKVACWGDNVHGELGTGGTGGQNPTPTTLASIANVFSVAAASRTTCALKKTGDVLCWGSNELGQLGTGTASSAPSPTPQVVAGLSATALWAGSDHACAVKSGAAGNVVCWGSGFFGQLGDQQTRDDASTPQATPVAVSSINNPAIGIGTGGNHSCAPLKTGAILCWGANEHGQLGDQQTTPQLTPDSVVGYP